MFQSLGCTPSPFVLYGWAACTTDEYSHSLNIDDNHILPPKHQQGEYAKKVGEVVKLGLPRVSMHVMKLCRDSHEGTEAWMDEILTPFMLMFG